MSEFIGYFERVRRRTRSFWLALPPEQVDWAPQPGEFSCGDIIRHIGAAEQMFVSVAIGRGWDYPGHERGLGAGHAEALAFLDSVHMSAMAALGSLGDADLAAERAALGGQTLAVWRVLMLMAEHEVHHRSQLATYMSLFGAEPPQIYGMRLEEVLARQGPG